MNGQIDFSGRAIISIAIRAVSSSKPHTVDVWIDTGFTGELVLPQQVIEELSLPESGTVNAVLADGSALTLNRYLCLVDWFNEERELEVVANAGEYPLLGVGMLLGHKLFVDYENGSLSIE